MQAKLSKSKCKGLLDAGKTAMKSNTKPTCRLIFSMLLAPVLFAAGPLRVGVAKRVITPDLKLHSPVYIAGYGNNRVATGIHDELYARCMAIDTSQRPLVLCGVDVIGVFWDDVQKIRAKVPGAQVVVAALHDHEGPDTMGLWGPNQGQTGINEAYMQFLIDRIAETAREAVGNLRPARVQLASFRSPELDSFIHDSRPPDVHDSDIIALRAVDLEGRPIGTLVNWANHPETLGSRNKLITADYSASLYKRLEELTGGTAVFINGAVGGMQSPGDAKVADRTTGKIYAEDSFEKADYIGARLAELAAASLRLAPPITIDDIVFREQVALIPMANKQFLAAAQAGVFSGRKAPDAQGRAQAPVGYIRLSGNSKPQLEIALIPGEMYPELSVGGVERYPGADFPEAAIEPPVKQLLSAPYRMLFGLADDENGYIIPKAEWDEKAPWLQNAKDNWYGEVNSLGPETAPIINESFKKLVAESAPKPR